MFVVCCSLCVVRRLLCIAFCVLCVACYLFFVFVVRVYGSLFMVCRVGACCSLFVVGCGLLVVVV